MSDEAIIWAGQVVRADPTTKGILRELAGVSDDDGNAWMRIADLATRVGASERTIQTRLRLLCRRADEAEEPGLGLLRETGRTHRIGTRVVPIYELLIDYSAVSEVLAARKSRRDGEAAQRSRMGATVCTHSPEPDDTVCTRMGATVCTPNEDKRGQVDADASTAGASAQAAVREIVDLWPIEALGGTDLAAAGEAIGQAVEELGDPAPLIRAVRAYLAERARRKHDYAPPALDRWLARGGWRALALRLRDEAAATAAAAPAMPALTVPPELAAAVAGARDEAFAASWLGRATWDGETRTLLVGVTAHQRLRPIWTDPPIAALNITLKERTA